MKLKMFETFQGAGVSALNITENMRVEILEPGEVYEVSEALGLYLLEHRKAEKVEEAPPAHQQPEPVQDDEKYPKPTKAKRKRGKHEADPS